jgi:sulfotransferase family protein
VTAAACRWPRGNSRLALVLSSERSGSTLLRVLLGKHSLIVSPSELWLLYYEEYDAWRRERPAAIESVLEFFELVGASTSTAAVDEVCRGRTTSEVYSWLFGFLPPGAILVDKTPGYANSISVLERSRRFDAFTIWLVRHPLGVISSHIRLANTRHMSWRPADLTWRLQRAFERMYFGRATPMVRAREAKWLRQNANILSFLRSIPPSHQIRLRFEDLVAHPEQTLRQVCAAMDLPWESSLARLELADQRITPGLGDATFHLHQTIETATAVRWQGELSENVLQPETVAMMKTAGLTSPA